MSLLISSVLFVKLETAEVINDMLVASETVKFDTNEASFSRAAALLLRSFSNVE